MPKETILNGMSPSATASSINKEDGSGVEQAAVQTGSFSSTLNDSNFGLDFKKSIHPNRGLLPILFATGEPVPDSLSP